MRHITLLTDFGTTEGEHAVLKGVIWRIVPGHPIADLSHSVKPQSIHEAALILERTTRYFPDETIHIVVVDPGVGTERRPIAARFGRQFFVGPDNGVCTPLLELAEKEGTATEIVHLDNPKYWLENISPVFHGRDIFAPCGGHLANGVPLNELGTPITDIVRYHLPVPTLEDGILYGEVIHIDHFGNVITNVRRGDIEPLGPVNVHLGTVELRGMVTTFGSRPAGDLIALYSPNDYLMIAVVNGSAAMRLSATIGDKVRVVPQSR